MTLQNAAPEQSVPNVYPKQIIIVNAALESKQIRRQRTIGSPLRPSQYTVSVSWSGGGQRSKSRRSKLRERLKERTESNF
jgi:hypothetical protein